MKLIFWLWAAALMLCLFAMAFIVSGGAWAQSSAICGSYSEFVAAITSQYEEQSLGKGFTHGGTAIVELFASPDTFTILLTDRTGRTCMISAGKKWVAEPAKIKGDDL